MRSWSHLCDGLGRQRAADAQPTPQLWRRGAVRGPEASLQPCERRARRNLPPAGPARLLLRTSSWSHCSGGTRTPSWSSSQAAPPPPLPPPRTKWTRRVPHPVLIGHAGRESEAARDIARPRAHAQGGRRSRTLCGAPGAHRLPCARRRWSRCGAPRRGPRTSTAATARPNSSCSTLRRVQLVRGEGRDVSS